MQLKAKKRGQILHVALQGELDHHSAKRFAEQIDTLMLQPDVRVIELDLQKLAFMDSSGIGVLLGRYKKIAARGGRMYVLNENKAIKKIFQISGLYQVIEHIS